MKKLFAILLIAGIFAACNDEGSTEESTTTDTTSPSTVTPTDTTTIRVDTPARPADTTIKK